MTITTEYPGTCAACGDAIPAGAPAIWSRRFRGRLTHLACAARTTASNGQQCQVCGAMPADTDTGQQTRGRSNRKRLPMLDTFTLPMRIRLEASSLAQHQGTLACRTCYRHYLDTAYGSLSEHYPTAGHDVPAALRGRS